MALRHTEAASSYVFCNTWNALRGRMADCKAFYAAESAENLERLAISDDGRGLA